MLETDSVTTLADYFVLCSGTSAPPAGGGRRRGEKDKKEGGPPPPQEDGGGGGAGASTPTGGGGSVHLLPEARAFYDLDRLWQDATVVDLSQVLQPGE